MFCSKKNCSWAEQIFSWMRSKPQLRNEKYMTEILRFLLVGFYCKPEVISTLGDIMINGRVVIRTTIKSV